MPPGNKGLINHDLDSVVPPTLRCVENSWRALQCIGVVPEAGQIFAVATLESLSPEKQVALSSSFSFGIVSSAFDKSRVQVLSRFKCFFETTG